MQERGYWKWTTWKISESVNVGNNGDCNSRSTSTMCHHLTIACRQPAIDLCDVCLVSQCNGVVLVPCDHWRFWATCADAVSKWPSYRPISTVNWRNYVLKCLKSTHDMWPRQESRLQWQTTVNSSQLCLTGGLTRLVIMGCTIFGLYNFVVESSSSLVTDVFISFYLCLCAKSNRVW